MPPSYSRVLMSVSAAVLAAVGLAGSFLPRETLQWLGSPPTGGAVDVSADDEDREGGEQGGGVTQERAHAPTVGVARIALRGVAVKVQRMFTTWVG